MCRSPRSSAATALRNSPCPEWIRHSARQAGSRYRAHPDACATRDGRGAPLRWRHIRGRRSRPVPRARCCRCTKTRRTDRRRSPHLMAPRWRRPPARPIRGNDAPARCQPTVPCTQTGAASRSCKQTRSVLASWISFTGLDAQAPRTSINQNVHTQWWCASRGQPSPPACIKECGGSWKKRGCGVSCVLRSDGSWFVTGDMGRQPGMAVPLYPPTFS